MFRNFFSTDQLFLGGAYPAIILGLILAWNLFWKGLALWRAAQAKQLYWFIPLLILNTMGILEIIFLLFFAHEKLNPKKIIKSLTKPLAKWDHSK